MHGIGRQNADSIYAQIFKSLRIRGRQVVFLSITLIRKRLSAGWRRTWNFVSLEYASYSYSYILNPSFYDLSSSPRLRWLDPKLAQLSFAAIFPG